MRFLKKTNAFRFFKVSGPGAQEMAKIRNNVESGRIAAPVEPFEYPKYG